MQLFIQSCFFFHEKKLICKLQDTGSESDFLQSVYMNFEVVWKDVVFSRVASSWGLGLL